MNMVRRLESDCWALECEPTKPKGDACHVSAFSPKWADARAGCWVARISKGESWGVTLFANHHGGLVHQSLCSQNDKGGEMVGGMPVVQMANSCVVHWEVNVWDAHGCLGFCGSIWDCGR